MWRIAKWNYYRQHWRVRYTVHAFVTQGAQFAHGSRPLAPLARTWDRHFFFFTAVTVLGFPEINKASIIKRTVLICSSVYKATAPWSRRTKESQAMLRFLQVPLGLSVTQLLEEVGHGESATATANTEASVSVLMFLLQRPNEKQHVRGCVCASVVFIREKQGGVIGM